MPTEQELSLLADYGLIRPTKVAKFNPATSLLAELADPPYLGQGSDQPMLRTQPLQPQEVLRISADKKRPSYAEFSKRYDEGNPLSV